MPTATQAKPAAAVQLPSQFKVKKFTGELPAVNGKERIASPFDDVVKASWDARDPETQRGETMLVEAAQNDDLRKAIVAQLHKAAKFVGCGLDLWRTLDDGVAFQTRPKRDVEKKEAATADAPAAA